MSEDKNCPKVYTPVVDNSAEECGTCGIVNTDCVIHSDAIEYLGIAVDSSVTEIIAALLVKIIDLEDRIVVLETP